MCDTDPCVQNASEFKLNITGDFRISLDLIADIVACPSLASQLSIRKKTKTNNNKSATTKTN
jgi:hypothetical protein